MVYFKITDGTVTRKFGVTPGEMTFDQLKERIASLFPKCLEEGCKDLHLKYRDVDGDVITISTDQEFQEALAELPKEHIWKLHIHGSKPKAPAKQAPSQQTVPHDFFFQPAPFHGPWGGFGRQGFFNCPWRRMPSWGSNWGNFGNWGNFDTEFDKMVDEHTKMLNTLHNDPEAEPMATGGAEATDAPEGSGEGTVAKGAEGGQVAPGKGNYQVKHFGSWEPKPFEGPYGKGRIIGPVGYYMSWSSGPEKEEGEKTTEEGEKGEKTAEEGMETSASAQ